jgi:hypothetical protein
VKRDELSALPLRPPQPYAAPIRRSFARAYIEEKNRLRAGRGTSALAIESEPNEVAKRPSELVHAIARGHRSSSLRSRLGELNRARALWMSPDTKRLAQPTVAKPPV